MSSLEPLNIYRNTQMSDVSRHVLGCLLSFKIVTVVDSQNLSQSKHETFNINFFISLGERVGF